MYGIQAEMRWGHNLCEHSSEDVSGKVTFEQTPEW